MFPPRKERRCSNAGAECDDKDWCPFHDMGIHIYAESENIQIYFLRVKALSASCCAQRIFFIIHTGNSRQKAGCVFSSPIALQAGITSTHLRFFPQTMKINHFFREWNLQYTKEDVFYMPSTILILPRGRALVARQAHNLEVAGSIPAPATN